MSDYSIFPKALDGYAQLPLFVDNITPVNAEGLNRIRSAIVNIEATLGILPQGDSNTVSIRLDLIEANIDSIEADIAIIEASLSTLESRVTIIEDSIYDLPNSLFLNEAPKPTPQANKGSIFVSDGSDGLIQNNPYYSNEFGVVTNLLSGSNLQDAYDGGNVIVTSGGADIDFDISAAGGGFSVDGDGSVAFGGTNEVASFGAYSEGSLTLQSRDESLIWMQTDSASDKTLTINGTNAGAGEGSVQIQAGDEIRLLPGTSFAPGSASKVKLPGYAFLSFGSPEIGITYAPFYNSLVVGFPPSALAGGGLISVSPATTPESILVQSVGRDTNGAGVGSNTGNLSLQTGNTESTSGNTAGNSGAITVKTGGAALGGGATAGGESGSITVETGQSGYDRTGYIRLRTGQTSASSTGVTGEIEIGTGILNGAGATSGNINLYTGSSATNSGNIVLTTGTASGIRGYIAFLSSVMNFNNGSQSINFYAGASDPNGVTASSSGSLLFDTSGVLWVSQGGTAWKALVGGSTGSTDNAVLRADGTSGTNMQSSGVTIDDSDNIVIPGTALVNGTTSAGKNAAVEIQGTDGSATDGAILTLAGSDGYPGVTLWHYQHDTVGIYFDAYYDALGDKSSDAGSNAAIYKFGDELQVGFDSGVAQGGTVAWNTSFKVDLTDGTITDSSYHILSGGRRLAYQSMSSSTYGLTYNKNIIGVNTTLIATPVINLPNPTTDPAKYQGFTVIIKDEGGASSGNAITINAAPGTTIDGSGSVTISTNYASLTLYSNGSNWFII